MFTLRICARDAWVVEIKAKLVLRVINFTFGAIKPTLRFVFTLCSFAVFIAIAETPDMVVVVVLCCKEK